MQVMLDTTSVDDRDPTILRALAKFLETVAASYELAIDAKPSINGKSDTPIELKAEPDFTPEDSLPADAFEQGKKFDPTLVVIPPTPTAIVIPLPPPVGPVTLTAIDKPPHIPLPPGPQPAPDVDTAGVAYDPNLHSSTKSKTIDGKWKARRNRGAAQVPAATTAAPLLPPPIEPPPSIPVPPSVLPPTASADDDVEVEADESAGLLPGANAVAVDFPTFITKITAGMNAGTITQARITEVMAQFKLDSLFSLNTKPELVGDVSKAFGFA